MRGRGLVVDLTSFEPGDEDGCNGMGPWERCASGGDQLSMSAASCN